LRYSREDWNPSELQIANQTEEIRVIVTSGSNRVKRGGNWNNNADNVRSANRNNNNPTNTNNNIGFRSCSTIVQQTCDVYGCHSRLSVLTDQSFQSSRRSSRPFDSQSVDQTAKSTIPSGLVGRPKVLTV